MYQEDITSIRSEYRVAISMESGVMSKLIGLHESKSQLHQLTKDMINLTSYIGGQQKSWNQLQPP